MEKELYKLGHNMKITEEIKPIDVDQIVTVNGEEINCGTGNQHILHLVINNQSAARISFFAGKDEKVEVVEECRVNYLKTLCKYLVMPLSKLLTQLDSNVAVPS